MQTSRRSFLARLAGAASMLVGGTPLMGCLGDGNSDQMAASGSTMQSSSAAPPTQTTQTSQSPPPPTSQPTTDSAPVWERSPTIEFVEGVPATISVREFVQDPDQDALVIKKESGTLLPGITWDPTRAILANDGRPLGAKPGAPVVVTGLTFSADDGKK
jgi:hypothetical protein